jgi:hypothetical protein
MQMVLCRKRFAVSDEVAPAVTWQCEYCGSREWNGHTGTGPLQAGDRAYCADCLRGTLAKAAQEPEQRPDTER